MNLILKKCEMIISYESLDIKDAEGFVIDVEQGNEIYCTNFISWEENEDWGMCNNCYQKIKIRDYDIVKNFKPIYLRIDNLIILF